MYPGLKQVRGKKWDTNLFVSMAAKKPKKAPRYNDPVEATLDVIGDKGKVLILFRLRDQVCRVGELTAHQLK